MSDAPVDVESVSKTYGTVQVLAPASVRLSARRWRVRRAICPW
ncbi:hypothetical protein [Isoptericola sp. AK164]|nr:hypothetical protein [Isoptericola sp. AK164]